MVELMTFEMETELGPNREGGRGRAPHRLSLVLQPSPPFRYIDWSLDMAEVEVSEAVSTPTVPSVEAGSGSVDKNALIARLDTLLEQYLNTLDEYEKLMQSLAKQLSSVRTTSFKLESHRLMHTGLLLPHPSKLPQPLWHLLRPRQLR